MPRPWTHRNKYHYTTPDLNKASTKSDPWQYLYREIQVDTPELYGFPYEPEDLEAREVLLDRKEHQLSRIMQAAEYLTDVQKRIFNLYFIQGLNTVEIGRLLDIGQSSVYKTIFGNDYYLDGVWLARHGGLVKKLQYLLGEAPEHPSILIKHRKQQIIP